jgi:hypothetical protein
MNDGRFISTYVRARVFDQYIRNVNELDNGNDYRHFLQNNGNQILNNLKAFHRENSLCKIEGKCLPLSGLSNDDMNTYLEKNKTPVDWKDNMLNNQNSLQSQETQEPETNNNVEELTGQKAQELAKSIYQQMLFEQEQNNLLSKVNNQ